MVSTPEEVARAIERCERVQYVAGNVGGGWFDDETRILTIRGDVNGGQGLSKFVTSGAIEAVAELAADGIRLIDRLRAQLLAAGIEPEE